MDREGRGARTCVVASCCLDSLRGLCRGQEVQLWRRIYPWIPKAEIHDKAQMVLHEVRDSTGKDGRDAISAIASTSPLSG